MIGKISGQYNLDALNRKKSRQSINYNNGYTNESDNANFSSFGTLLSRVNAEMKNIPDVREDVVTTYKTQIEQGTYNPPLDKLANSLLVAGMLDAVED